MQGSKPATKAEKAHMLRCKEGVCVACLIRCAAKLLPYKWVQVGNDGTRATFWGLLEYNHTKSGNIRRGHLYGYALCVWHHRGNQAQPPDGWTHAQLRDRYGPSLMDGSALFSESYGSDDELIEIQRLILSDPANFPPENTP